MWDSSHVSVRLFREQLNYEIHIAKWIKVSITDFCINPFSVSGGSNQLVQTDL